MCCLLPLLLHSTFGFVAELHMMGNLIHFESYKIVVISGTTYTDFVPFRTKLLMTAKNSISDLPPIGLCIEFLIGSKYARVLPPLSFSAMID